MTATPVSTLESSESMVLAVARGASAKKATDTTVLRVGPLIGITEYFLITSGSNPRQVRTIAEEIERLFRTLYGLSPMSVEGYDDARWVLLDFGEFVVHVFIDEARSYYDIERLWSDAERIDVDVVSPESFTSSNPTKSQVSPGVQ